MNTGKSAGWNRTAKILSRHPHWDESDDPLVIIFNVAYPPAFILRFKLSGVHTDVYVFRITKEGRVLLIDRFRSNAEVVEQVSQNDYRSIWVAKRKLEAPKELRGQPQFDLEDEDIGIGLDNGAEFLQMLRDNPKLPYCLCKERGLFTAPFETGAYSDVQRYLSSRVGCGPSSLEV